MDIEEIRQFLIKANRNGYGNETTKQIDEPDSSHTITYSEGDWQFHDNFFGGEPFGGREVISLNKRPVWMMVYYGVASEISISKQIYSFLKKALVNFTDDKPYRGPTELKEGDWKYQNDVVGEFTNFSGIESITLRGNEVYQAKYQGGLIDKS